MHAHLSAARAAQSCSRGVRASLFRSAGILGCVAVFTAAACSSATKKASTTAPASGGAEVHVVNVTMTGDECVADRAEYAAGALTFIIENKDATGIKEVEILQGERILGEKENLPPGFKSTLSLDLSAGDYALFCPGAINSRVPFTVTGTRAVQASGSTHDLLIKATEDYKSYVVEQVGLLVKYTAPLLAALKGNEVATAQAAYIAARPYYERIEPVAEKFSDLDASIDARPETGQTIDQITGFHRVEYGLFTLKSLSGLAPVGDRLLSDVKALQARTSDLTYQPADLANGATALLEEVSSGKLTGEEEAYSHIDLLDMQANVEGSQQLFALLEAGLTKIDPDTATTIAARFTALDKVVDGFRDTNDPSGLRRYDTLSAEETKNLQEAVLAVHDPLSRVAAKVVNA